MGAASYVVGSHNLRGGATLSNGDWRLIDHVDRRCAADQLQRGRADVGDAAASDRIASNGIDRDLGLYVQDRWVDGAHHAGTSGSASTSSSASRVQSEVISRAV